MLTSGNIHNTSVATVGLSPAITMNIVRDSFCHFTFTAHILQSYYVSYYWHYPLNYQNVPFLLMVANIHLFYVSVLLSTTDKVLSNRD